MSLDLVSRLHEHARRTCRPSEVAAFRNLCDVPNCGPKPGLPDLHGAADAEWAALEAFHAEHRGCPLGPVFHVLQHSEDSLGRRVDVDGFQSIAAHTGMI